MAFSFTAYSLTENRPRSVVLCDPDELEIISSYFPDEIGQFSNFINLHCQEVEYQPESGSPELKAALFKVSEEVLTEKIQQCVWVDFLDLNNTENYLDISNYLSLLKSLSPQDLLLNFAKYSQLHGNFYLDKIIDYLEVNRVPLMKTLEYRLKIVRSKLKNQKLVKMWNFVETTAD